MKFLLHWSRWRGKGGGWGIVALVVGGISLWSAKIAVPAQWNKITSGERYHLQPFSSFDSISEFGRLPCHLHLRESRG